MSTPFQRGCLFWLGGGGEPPPPLSTCGSQEKIKLDSNHTRYIQGGLGFIGYYKEGRPVGQAWKGLVGGWIHGKAEDENGRTFSGERIAYLYDDGHTALVGHFNNSIMVSC